MELLFVLLLALALDALVGEPPRAMHPVAWMGKAISLLERFAPTHRESQVISQVVKSQWTLDSRLRTLDSMPRQLVYGGVMVLFTIFIFASPVYFLLLYVNKISMAAYIIVGALLLKSTFSFRELRHSALEIKAPLTRNNLEEARAKMPALVSRETQSLEKPALVSATVESVAENICDSFVAPLFYFLLFGVPGAMAYRVVNTLDAMIGYHGKYEYLGKCAAKLDDILNFIPARISGLLLVIASYLCKEDGRKAWQVMLRDHAKTESPNAGWTMSAMAGALRIRLEKVGYYSLGNTNNPLSPQLIVSGIRLAEISALLWFFFLVIVEVTYFVLAA